MYCYSCLNARQAGNHDLVGCSYWTAIFRGNSRALKTVLSYINQKENYKIDLDNTFVEKEAIGFLIDILIEDYAPKPLYEGWVDLNLPYTQKRKRGEMTDACVVLNPQSCCKFYNHQDQVVEEFQDMSKLNLRT